MILANVDNESKEPTRLALANVSSGLAILVLFFMDVFHVSILEDFVWEGISDGLSFYDRRILAYLISAGIVGLCFYVGIRRLGISDKFRGNWLIHALLATFPFILFVFYATYLFESQGQSDQITVYEQMFYFRKDIMTFAVSLTSIGFVLFILRNWFEINVVISRRNDACSGFKSL